MSMRKLWAIMVVISLGCAASVCRAEGEACAVGGSADILVRESLSNGFGGLNDRLGELGVEVALGATQIYQQNVHGGVSTHDRRGRYSGSYDLVLSADMERLLGIEGGSISMLAEGSWPRDEGIDEISVGSFTGINADAGGRRSLDVTEFWYEQHFADETLFVRLGKLDLTCGFACRGCPVSFDGSAFANDETAQFLNDALVNNPTIPFPDNGLGVVIHWNPIDWWYIGVGAADAQADARETGFKTAFNDEDYFFYALETGVTPQLASANGPLQGAYRVGVWYDPQDKARFSDGSTKRDDGGIYFSCDQAVLKENADEQDSQGLGVFARVGWSSSEVEPEATFFWSAGAQYQGLIANRDDDVVAFGVAQATFSDKSDVAEDAETVFELYYNAAVTGWLALSPSVQYVMDPAGADTDVKDATIIALRAQITF